MTYRPIFRDDGESPERRTTPDFSKFKVHDSYHKPVMDNLPPGDPADSKRLSRRWLEESADFAHVRPMLTPRFIPSCTDELMAGLGRLQREFGAPMQSHLSENLSEIAWVAELCPGTRFYGEAYARMRIYYEPTKTIYEEEWSPPECVEALNAVTDGMAEGESHCTKMPNLDVDGRCTTMDGVIVCPEDMVTPPNSDINPLCQEMELTTDYDFYQGQMDCWIDPQGNKICPDNVGGKLDDCETYEKDPKCTFIKSECVDGAQGASGTCYVTEMTYDCGEDVDVTDTEAETTYKCPGDIACMGNECIDTSHSVSNSFAQVTALMNALQYMTQDMECTGQEKDEGTGMHLDSINCTVFGGEPGECKKAVGGMQNCCEPVPGVGLSDYITLI